MNSMKFPAGVDPDKPEQCPVAVITKTVEVYFGLDEGDIIDPARYRYIVRPRHIAYWLARHITGQSYSELGRRFDRRHDTIIRGIQSLERCLKTDPYNEDDPSAADLESECQELLSRLSYLKPPTRGERLQLYRETRP